MIRANVVSSPEIRHQLGYSRYKECIHGAECTGSQGKSLPGIPLTSFCPTLKCRWKWSFLLRWCRNNNYLFECIFLTSHADFFYAKEAIQLGSFDYILQPARYEDVENAIKKPFCELRKAGRKRIYRLRKSRNAAQKHPYERDST